MKTLLLILAIALLPACSKPQPTLDDCMNEVRQKAIPEYKHGTPEQKQKIDLALLALCEIEYNNAKRIIEELKALSK